MRLSLSRRAQLDLDQIWTYIASDRDATAAADRVVDSIATALSLLSRNPYLGRRRDSDLRPGLRSQPVGNYIIFYRVNSGTIKIVRIPHGSRNIRLILGDR